MSPFAPRMWRLAHGRSLELGPRGILMGILNVTPDSFSDGGNFGAVEAALPQARAMAKQGAAIIDIGGESTRPGAEPVTAGEEQARILPVIEALAGHPGFAISVDTYRAETARRAVEAGAHIVNDINGALVDDGMAKLASETGAGIVLMNNRRGRGESADVIGDAARSLEKSCDAVLKAGADNDQVVLDPGFGFHDGTDDSWPLIAGLERLHALDCPLLIGTSRKRFLGAVTGREAQERDVATAATTALCRMRGAAIFRVHAVAPNRDALAVADALIAEEHR